MSLRTRLVVLTVAVVAIALAAADTGAYLALRSLMVSRAENDLTTATNQSLKILFAPTGPGGATLNVLSNGTTAVAFAVYDPKGLLIGQSLAVGIDKADLPGPVLPDPATIPPMKAGTPTEGPYDARGSSIVVPAISGGFDYLLSAIRAKDGSVAVIAFPMREAAATLGQLAQIEIAVTIIVLALVAVIATLLVALALRPLAAIEGTAARIAAGELGRRIDGANQRTEVGRLGLALNTMLSRIEEALGAREASEQRLRRLVTDASHELRTPLTSIRGYAELFRRGADARPADLARAMRGIETESQRMAVLVDELLLLARLDEGQASPATAQDLVPIVSAAIDAARAVEPDRPIELVAPPSALVRADGGGLRQIVDNLLANVRVHTPPESPATVTIRSVAERTILEVADTGPGLTAEARSRVFERFFRADPSRSRDSGGSGLGLAIVAALARAYGGDVRVESEPGHGARFIVEWPNS